MKLCGPDAGGLSLAAGNHSLRSMPGSSVGMDIDQLALASAPGGGPTTVQADGQLPAPTTGTSPAVVVDRQTSTALQLTISKVSAGTSPFALVLGQSVNAGWKATTSGHSLGTPFLIDGFANGWRVDPAKLAGAIHDGTMTVELQWAPQKEVDIAVVISAAGHRRLPPAGLRPAAPAPQAPPIRHRRPAGRCSRSGDPGRTRGLGRGA